MKIFVLLLPLIIMKEISTKIIESCVYELAKTANIKMPKSEYELICNSFDDTNCNNETEDFIKLFKQNACLANKKQRPLCQDTGQVVVFVKVGQGIAFTGKFIKKAINDAVERCYKENFFRKSVVKDALFDRENTQNNTPAIVHTEYTDENCVEINVLIKGGGAENKTELLMMSPTSTQIDIISKIADIVSKAGTSACPPYFLGIGIGSTAENALLLSKKAFFEGNKTEKIQFFAEKMKDYVNAYVTTTGFEIPVIDIKILTSATHIACLPVAISFNCHSIRHAGCKIYSDSEIKYTNEEYIPDDCNFCDAEDIKRVGTEELESLRALSSGEKILLSGEIYTARDAAHNEFLKLTSEGSVLPIDLKNKIVFYAGPCPKNENEIIGPVGPTTSSRMDKFADFTIASGVVATIGKGERSEDVIKKFRENNVKYFTVYGGISNCLANCVKSMELVAFEQFGAEAVYKLKVENLPLVCKI